MKGHRLFIAITIPSDIQRRLFKEVEEWRDLPIRWTKEENIHITLLFIGTADDEEMSRIASVLPMAVEGTEPFEITLNRIGIGPDPKKPRMVWAEGEAAPALANLQKLVAGVIFEGSKMRVSDDDEGEEDGRMGASEGKPFHLHATLGRMMPFQWKKLGSSAPKIEKTLDVSFPVSSVELMESELGPKGPTYTVLSSAALG